jgi:CelD/BcsL family acetyltransferase involved in cellulose biosynthesis
MTEVEEDWARLSSDPLNSLHQSPEWCKAWAKAHNVPLYFLRGKMEGDTVLLWPLELKSMFGCRVLRPIGGSFNNINTGLVQPNLLASNRSSDIAQAIHKISAAISSIADVLTLTSAPLNWRGRINCLGGLQSVQSQNDAFQLPILGSFDETLAQINAKRRRKKFRISQRQAEDMGGYLYKTAQEPAEKLHILNEFFAQKAKRFKSQGLPDVFAQKQIKAFFANLLNERSSQGEDAVLELHYIELQGAYEGQIASITGISRKGDHCICQFGSINEALDPSLSPGELLFYHVIERECAMGSALFDFGIGDQRYKRSWCPVMTKHHNIYVPSTLKGKLLVQGMIAGTRAKAAVKKSPHLYNLLQKLRCSSQD